MSRTLSHPDRIAGPPVWDLAYLFPAQGSWSDEDYLALDTTRLIEFSDGSVEVLPMPTEEHQSIVLYLYTVLRAFVDQRKLGKLLIAPFPIQLWEGKYREPDLAFMLRSHARRRTNRFWRGADLVIEVVSRSRKDRARDLRTKRLEYARAGISEYWIVDPLLQTITVLGLAVDAYEGIGIYSPKDGGAAGSRLLRGFNVSPRAVFNESSR